MKNKASLFLVAFILSVLAVLITINPEICKNSAINGILLCGRVIIPSLFPFTACVLFITKSGVISLFQKIDFITRKIFGLNSYLFCLVLLSFLGGYPIGAKLLNEAVANKSISPEKAKKMLNYCINAGPAFIVGAVGNGILGSKKAGYILLACHILSSLILLFVLRDKQQNTISFKSHTVNLADCFVESVAAASEVCMNICGYVLFFSVICAYIEHFSLFLPILKPFPYILEITNAIPKTNNIYLISFLLGFSGICVWCQISALTKNIKIRFFSFAFFRILHGILSCLLSALTMRIFGVSLYCVSNNVAFSASAFYSTPALSVSLIIMMLLFLISLFAKKHTGKFIEDVI